MELEYQLQESLNETRHKIMGDLRLSSNRATAPPPIIPFLGPLRLVEIEMLIPGLCTMEVKIPAECTVSAIKKILVDHANVHLLSFLEKEQTVAKSWMVLAMFGYDDMYDIALEEEAISRRIQIERMRTMFNLTVTKRKNKRASDDEDEWVVQWNERCRFALVIFSVNHTVKNSRNEEMVLEEPWTFVHVERPGAPATFLENTLNTTHLRAWDFVSGKAYWSRSPIVFSYAGEDFSNDCRIDRRAFMKVSTTANEPQQYHEPGQILLNGDADSSGYILGMGENAIVHRVELIPSTAGKKLNVDDAGTQTTEDAAAAAMMRIDEDSPMQEEETQQQQGSAPGFSTSSGSTASSSGETHDDLEDENEGHWDAAVKRPITLSKMLATLKSPSSEAGLAKRLRFANGLNSDGRIVEFYGLGIAFACNAYNPSQFKYELVLMSRTSCRGGLVMDVVSILLLCLFVGLVSSLLFLLTGTLLESLTLSYLSFCHFL